MIELTLPSGEPLVLKPASANKFRGSKIPGSLLFQVERNNVSVYDHEFNQRGYIISHKSATLSGEDQLTVKETTKWLRFETVIFGELSIRTIDGNETKLLPGQYHFTDELIYQLNLQKDQNCSYFSVYFSPELLGSLELAVPMQPLPPSPLPQGMKELIFELLDNPYSEELLPFYYGNTIRELLFMHLAAPPVIVPGELTAKQIASMYEVDRIMQENLESEITIGWLAKKIGTNTFFLKKAYEQVFGTGIFARLIKIRMEKAKFLLEKTDKPLKEICEMSGYGTLAGFITEFRKKFGVTPNTWRKSRRGL